MIECIKLINERNRSFLIGFYKVMIGSLLLGYLIIQAFDDESLFLPVWVLLIRFAVSIFSIWLGHLWKEKGFRAIIIFFLYQTIRVIVKKPEAIFTYEVSNNLFNGFWVITGCYSLGKILNIIQLKRFLRFFIAVWTIGTVIHCSLALYAAWTDKQIVNLGGYYFWGFHPALHRLQLGYIYATTNGSFLSISGIIALCGLLVETRIRSRVLFGIAYFMIIISLGLTDSRTSFISLSASAGVLAGLSVLYLIRKQKRDKENEIEKNRQRIVTVVIPVICTIAIFAVSLLVIMKVTPVFNAVHSNQELFVSTARAKEPKTDEIAVNRGLSGENTLNGREIIWKTVIKYIVENPWKLLFGESIYNTMSGPNQRMGSSMGHCHNMVLQILLEGGLFGLLLIFAFVVYNIGNAFRIIRNRTLPLWILLILAIPVSVLISDLAECFGWFAEWKGPALPFLFVSCGIINVIGSKRSQLEE